MIDHKCKKTQYTTIILVTGLAVVLFIVTLGLAGLLLAVICGACASSGMTWGCVHQCRVNKLRRML